MRLRLQTCLTRTDFPQESWLSKEIQRQSWSEYFDERIAREACSQSKNTG